MHKGIRQTIVSDGFHKVVGVPHSGCKSSVPTRRWYKEGRLFKAPKRVLQWEALEAEKNGIRTV